MRALLLLAAAALPALTFTDPAPVAETTVAAPPAIIVADGRIHLFWLDRPAGSPRATGEVWHGALAPDGRIAIAPRRIEAGADTRFAWPVAALAGSRIHLAWMARGPGGLGLRVTVLETTGSVAGRVSPAAGMAEEGGRISLLVTGGSGTAEHVHLAWSQFDRGARRVWYARLDAAGRVTLPGRAVVEGEAPALTRDEGVRLLWWTGAGAGTYILRTAALEAAGSVGPVEDLSGSLLLADPLPPIPSSGSEGLDILVPTLERSFRTSGQLYLIRLRGGSATARLPLSRGRPLGDVVAWTGGEPPLLVWAEPAGRRQNGEIFAARLDAATGQLAELSRVSYTPSGSLRPAVTGPFPTAAWLETVEVGRFRLVVGMAGGRRRTALLNAPELDAARPASAAAFAAAVILSVLPFAALFAAVFGLA
ncbi:MAG TPA: hypothetical protein VFW08_05945, partial [bacterium]|nr:hypothetical protein [bacterium]